MSRQAGAPVPPATRQWDWAVALVAFLVPLLSCGLLSWSVIALMATRRRSRVLAVAAAVYLLLVIVGFVVLGSSGTSEDAPATLGDTVGATCLFAAWAGGVTHVVLLLAAGYTRSDGGHGPPVSARRLPDTAVIEAIERRVRREQALGLLDRHPDIARRLGIGRPDLPRTFDDGGLIDLNAVPEHVLASLPGITSAQARAIVAERELSGGFWSVAEPIAHGLLPDPLPDGLRSRLIAVPRT